MSLVVFVLFFFQAEDGIRDAQESRGLGDVYKRQIKEYPKLIAKQKETWDSIHHPHVHTIYYYSSHTLSLIHI